MGWGRKGAKWPQIHPPGSRRQRHGPNTSSWRKGQGCARSFAGNFRILHLAPPELSGRKRIRAENNPFPIKTKRQLRPQAGCRAFPVPIRHPPPEAGLGRAVKAERCRRCFRSIFQSWSSESKSPGARNPSRKRFRRLPAGEGMGRRRGSELPMKHWQRQLSP